MVKTVWSEFAMEDLRSIHEYISKDSKASADKFVEKIISKVSQLESFPESGRIVPEFDTASIRELIDLSVIV